MKRSQVDAAWLRLGRPERMNVKNIFVVGGAGGVGTALVDMLVERGDRIVATVLSDQEADGIAARHGATVVVHKLDLADAETSASALARIADAQPSIDAVIVCAGVLETHPLEITPLASFRRLFEINCLATVASFQAAAPKLRESRGRIVAISSSAGRVAMPFIGAYVASKFALEGVADVIRRETSSQGITISLVEPGGIRTTMTSDQLATVQSRLANLGSGDRERYAHLYRAYEALATESWDSGSSTPEEVAQIMLKALDDPAPDPRYVVGEQATQMLDTMSVMSDREIDAMVIDTFAR